MNTLKSLDQLITQMRLEGMGYEEATKAFRRQFMLQVLKECRMNQCHAAAALGLHRNTISRHLDELDIDLQQVKRSRPGMPRGWRKRSLLTAMEAPCQPS